MQKFGVFEGQKYGNTNRVMVNIDDGYLILPERFDKLMTDPKFLDRASQMNLSIIFDGRDHKKGNRLKIRFV